LHNWIEIAGDHLAANFRTLQTAAGAGTEVLAVVKARAYGHGAEHCAAPLVRAGAQWLGVTNATEGSRVRAALGGLPARILVMCDFAAPYVCLMHEANLTPVVWTLEQVAALAARPLPLHLEIDTGMSRQGVRPGAELAGILTAIRAANLRLEGVLTHFTSSEEPESRHTRRQQELFAAAIAQIREAGLSPDWVHAGASSAIDNPAYQPGWLAELAASVGARPMVRTGLALYGYGLPLDPGATPRVIPAVKPVLTWKVGVISTRTVEPGDTIGYNATFTVRKPMRIALLSVGFANGLRRELSSTNDRPGGWVMLHGRRASILGRISMNHTVVDVTHIPEVEAGDTAILLGPGVTADDHARLAHTTAYEILCGIQPGS
jgi:alanine racemase